MRKILFRGKRTYNGEWVEEFYVCLHDQKGNASPRIYNGYAESDCGDLYPDWWEVNPNTVGQFTGLIDKNGKKIFEGDKVEVYDSWGKLECIGTVSWNDTFLAWHCGKPKAMYGDSLTSYRVIGNIYDMEIDNG